MRACARYADTYARNYYAWTHRLLLLPSVVSLARSAEELDVLYRWSRTHVSDASALHYRAQLLLAMSVHESGIAKFADDEISKLTELIQFYEGHEALFCYLRFLLIFSPSAALAPLMRRLCAQGGKQRRLALNVLAWLMLFKARATTPPQRKAHTRRSQTPLPRSLSTQQLQRRHRHCAVSAVNDVSFNTNSHPVTRRCPTRDRPRD